MQYRSEIDGLRALAVVPVILFHAGFELFSGGFIGVDVFFVISGYLITSILIDDIQNRRFTISGFYERRARRILPALFVVMFVCIPFSWLQMYAPQMKDFSQSLVAVSLFASNILFWRETGYFDVASEQKPLLHTWSLAVEEQYYVVFPIFLIIFWPLGKNRVFWIIVGIAAISLILSEWGWRNQASANFYLSPTRAWELLSGSIAAFIVHKQGVRDNNFLATLGLSAIVFSIFCYDSTTPFPSVYALVPVLGVVFLVLYAGKDTFANYILSTRAFVGIGVISYSVYLWHQPLFAFARILWKDHPSSAVMSALSILSIALGYLSWRFIERPFRSPNIISRKQILIGSTLGMSFFIFIGSIGHFADGYPDNESSEIIVDTQNMSHINIPVYLIGDSHAEHLISGFETLNSAAVMNMTSDGCIPFRNVDRYDYRFKVGACADAMNAHLNTLKAVQEPSVVVISSMGPVYLDGTPFKGKDYARVTGLGVELITDRSITDHYKIFEIGMRQTLSELTSNPNLTTIFATDIPELGIDNGCQNNGKKLTIFGFEIRDFTDTLTPEQCSIPRSEYDERVSNYKKLISKVLADFPEIYSFDPTHHFCNKEKCFGIKQGFGYLYRDVDHLSTNGSIFFVNNLLDAFHQIK